MTLEHIPYDSGDENPLLNSDHYCSVDGHRFSTKVKMGAGGAYRECIIPYCFVIGIDYSDPGDYLYDPITGNCYIINNPVTYENDEAPI